jgi:chitodextrinase
LTVNFSNGITSPPVNKKQFEPSTGLPAENGKPFVVAAAGDGASGELNAVEVTTLISKLNPNMLLYLGDVYEKGSISEFYNWYGSQNNNFARFRSITNPTIGNHEYENGVAPGYFDYWDNIPNYYSFDAGGWHFISLNSNTTYYPTGRQSAQYQWLKKDLTEHDQACTIVYYHQPLFNIGQEGPALSLKSIWSLLAEHEVPIVLNGHDHSYQRWVPLNGEGQPSPNGVTEFIAGASGHGLETFKGTGTTDRRLAFSIDANPTAFGVLLLHLNQKGVTFNYVNTDGTTLDSGVVPCIKAGPDTKAPPVPVDLTAVSKSATQVDLKWSASSDDTGVNGYTIYRNGSVLTTVPGSATSYSDDSAKPATSYQYTVDAVDLAGNHSTRSVSVSAATPVMPPTLKFPVNADTYVSADFPTVDYGAATVLRVDGTPDTRTYLRFNVKGLADLPITRARLMVYAANKSDVGIKAFAISDNEWDETKMNFKSAPPLGDQLASSGPITIPGWVTLDVTPYVTGAGTYSFAFTTEGKAVLSFPSREVRTNVAKLVLDIQNNGQAASAVIPSTVTFNPLADSYVNEEKPETNYGSSPFLRADSFPDLHTYLRFSVNKLNGFPIVRARLRVYVNSFSNSGLNLQLVPDSTWDEKTINFNNAPELGSIIATTPPVSAETWVEFDVTTSLRGEGIYSFAITTASHKAIGFSSLESDVNMPQLIIDLETGQTTK